MTGNEQVQPEDSRDACRDDDAERLQLSSFDATVGRLRNADSLCHLRLAQPAREARRSELAGQQPQPAFTLTRAAIDCTLDRTHSSSLGAGPYRAVSSELLASWFVVRATGRKSSV